MMGGALGRILEDGLRAQREAIESTDGERPSGADLLALAGRVETALKAHGITAGEPVLLRMGNRPADLGALLGLWRAGAVAVPLHVAAAPSTYDRLRSQTAARF